MMMRQQKRQNGSSATTRELTDKVKRSDSALRSSNVSASLAQLRLDNMRLHGREDDLKLLKSKLRNLRNNNNNEAGTSNNNKNGLLLVSGISGTGKSALVMKGLKDPANKLGVAFAAGKFDLNHSALPLSAFAAAITTLTNYVLEQENAQQIKDAIKLELGENDKMLLVRALPGSRDLFSVPSIVGEDNAQQRIMEDRNSMRRRRSSLRMLGGGGEDNSNQQHATLLLHYAIRRLLKVICINIKGLVMFIDDLQWCDTTTLALIKSISLDKDIPSFLLVGAYREDEVTDSHPLALQIRELKQIGIDVTTIKIGNLAPKNVKFLVAEALGMEDDEEAVDTLAATVHKKTEGNAFFVIMFLRSLYDEGLIQFNFGVMKWLWDDDAVKARLVTQNVATVMVNKLRRLRRESQNVLKVASCLGASFSTSIVATVVETLSSAEDTDSESVSSSVREFEEEGLWDKETEEVCRFSHDQVQSAAFELIEPSERDSFRGEVGGILMNKLDPELLENYFFEVVSLRNCAKSSISSDEERNALIEMNIRAGEKAYESAGFDAAVVYFRAGRELMGDNGWETNPSQMLQLCSEEANALFINGDIEMMNVLVDEVLMRDIPVAEKFRAYEVKILSLQAAQKFDESITTALEVRKQLGLTAPRNKATSPITVLKEYVKTSRTLKNLTSDDILAIPELEDERIIMGQRMLELLIVSTYQAQPTVFPLIVFLLVRTSVKHGINASSCDAFATFGLLLCAAFGQIKRGSDMARAVDLILAKPGMQRMKSRSFYIIEGFIRHWTVPIRAGRAPLLEGYQSGLETGDVESAAFNIAFRGCNGWFVGISLAGLQQELETNLSVLQQLNQRSHEMNVLAYLLVVKMLRGRATKQQTDMGFHELLKEANYASSEGLRSTVMLMKLELLVIYQDWEGALLCLIKAGEVRTSLLGTFAAVRFTFLEALVYLKPSKARTTLLQRQKFKRRSLKSMKMLRSWLKKGNVNVVHYMHILTAEHALLNGNWKSAEESFKSAVTVAAKNGFLQDKGLAHELANAYFSAKGDKYWANYHIEMLHKTYSEWGATSKVEQLSKNGS